MLSLKQSLKKGLKKIGQKILKNGQTTTPLITIKLSQEALVHNLNTFRKLNQKSTGNTAIAPTLKSNAYGHGIVLVAKILEGQDIPFIVVDSYFEAQLLRNEDITIPLLILGYSTTETILSNILKNISFTITSLDALKELHAEISGGDMEKAGIKNIRIKNSLKLHLKIDTGMNRQGISYGEIDEAFELAKKIEIEGIASHFSDSDGADPSFTEKQIEKWNSIVARTKRELPSVRYFHISNTSGNTFTKKIEANVSRLGIGLYGLTKIPNLQLKPVLEMKTIITGVKKIKKGDTVGYNNTFSAERDMTIATIPVGYYEGIDRRLSNKGFLKVDGVDTAIIGRVSMNITTIDVTDISNVKIGDIVEVISSTKEDRNSIESMAKICGTIPYEITVKINGDIKRIVV